MYYINNDIETTDKFDAIKFIELDEDCVLDTLSSYMLFEIPYLPVYGNLTIKVSTQYRPDLLSYDLYGDTQYWWILLWYNGLSSPKDLTVGTKINYPGLNSLEQLYTETAMKEKLE